jgi:2-dehydro-3-deoxyphosphooctonate aldolase (KDO 8-P synthase)
MQKKVNLGKSFFSNDAKLSLIAGPCVLESHDHAKKMVESLLEINERLKINFIYKTSFDKANRTSLKGQRGVGLEVSLPIFDKIKKKFINKKNL